MCDVVDDDSAVCVAVVHGGEGLVALLASRVPDLKLDRRVVVEGNGLGEEGSADGGFPVVVKLVLRGSAGTWEGWRACYFDKAQDERRLRMRLADMAEGGRRVPGGAHLSDGRLAEQDELELGEAGARVAWPGSLGRAGRHGGGRRAAGGGRRAVEMGRSRGGGDGGRRRRRRRRRSTEQVDGLGPMGWGG